MFCAACGAQNPDQATFCNSCGSPTTAPAQQPAAYGAPGQPGYGAPGYGPPGYGQPGQNPYGHMAPPRTSGYAIAGFVLAFFCSILGLIFSIMAKNEIRDSNGALTGNGLATAGIVISIIGMVLGFLQIVIAAGG